MILVMDGNVMKSGLQRWRDPSETPSGYCTDDLETILPLSECITDIKYRNKQTEWTTLEQHERNPCTRKLHRYKDWTHKSILPQS